MGRVKRSNALSGIFMRYVLVMLGSLVGLVIVAYLLLYLLISVGCIYPANYAEQKINEAYDTAHTNQKGQQQPSNNHQTY